MSIPYGLCGRIAPSTGRPCRSKTQGLSAMAPDTRAPACGWHMTPEERDAWEQRKEQHKRDMLAAYLSTWKGGDPACWSWEPMPEGADWWEWHPFLCAICGRGGDLQIDHDHATGLVRGRLCRYCNVNEGGTYVEGDVYDKYRQRNPASMWGFREVYWDPWRGEAKPAPVFTLDEIAAVVERQAAIVYARIQEKPGA